jgi:ABC-type transport system involved in cytochrome bd biosynthesis fused ATPase/permease subunit
MYNISYSSQIVNHKKCDRIYEFFEGKIIASGQFDQLRASSRSFRNMIELQSFDV